MTYSADTPEIFGYADIAIRQFDAEEGLKVGSHRIIVEDWSYQYSELNQGRWAYLFRAGLTRSGRKSRE